MADKGSIGSQGGRTKAVAPQGVPNRLRRLVCNDVPMTLGGRDNTEGNSSQPSLRLNNRGIFRFRWVVASGSRSISIDVKQAVNTSPRPSLVILANADISVATTTGTAGSSTGWVTIGPVSITPSSAGAVLVELRANYDGQYAPSYWDNIVVT